MVRALVGDSTITRVDIIVVNNQANLADIIQAWVMGLFLAYQLG